MKKYNIKKTNNSLSFLDFISSFVLSIFIILPLLLVDINLLYLYYDYEIWLVFGLVLLFLLLVILNTKFLSDIYKKKYNEYINLKLIYIKNILIADIIAIIIFVLYLILRR